MCRFLRRRARYRKQANHQEASLKAKTTADQSSSFRLGHLCMSSGSDNQTTFHSKAPPVANH
ncbi:hypothetical protein FAM18110_00233 [Lacticaseibacillus paracasei]|nr:hypothetical protein FAM18110_00233 [Lacticaseibacillus paracasei]RND94060.1 hypothetical protein FAM18175_00136 [Lacticaseibacillus paracasei]